MRLSRFFVDQPLQANQSITLNEKLSHYLNHVLRFKSGAKITLFNGQSEQEHLSLISRSGKKIDVEILESFSTQLESPLITTLYQALSKNEHIDLTIQKCTELGISNLIFFNSERTQIPLKANKLEKKLFHWQRVAQSACEQCGRNIVPSIVFKPQLNSALESSTANIKVVLDFEGESLRQKFIEPSLSVDILLGAEGGLTPNEILFAESQHFIRARLGKRVLRTETAAISALALTQMLLGDLN